MDGDLLAGEVGGRGERPDGVVLAADAGLALDRQLDAVRARQVRSEQPAAVAHDDVEARGPPQHRSEAPRVDDRQAEPAKLALLAVRAHLDSQRPQLGRDRGLVARLDDGDPVLDEDDALRVAGREELLRSPLRAGHVPVDEGVAELLVARHEGERSRRGAALLGEQALGGLLARDDVRVAHGALAVGEQREEQHGHRDHRNDDDQDEEQA